MSTYKTREIKAVLTSKGFQEHESHHTILRLCVEGRITKIRTQISHGLSEYGDNLLSLMAKQLKLRRHELDDLIECPMTKEAYIDHLQKNGHIRLQ